LTFELAWSDHEAMTAPDLLGSYVEKVRRGERPTEDEALAFLRDWHSRHPGATGRVLAPYRLASGESTYERLAAYVPSGSDLAVLDLCCGDGVLVELVARRLGSGGSVTGVDASKEDLEAARVRVPDPRVRLHGGQAGALLLPAATIDAVLCHYALMLIRPLEGAVVEIARVLRPGGLFAAIIPSRWNLADVAPDAAALVRSIWQRDMPAFPDIGLGEPRLQSDGPAAFFHAASGFASADVETLWLEKRTTVEEVVSYIELTYPFDLLLADGQRRVRKEVRALLARAASEDGCLPLRQGISLLTCRRLAAEGT
jgi:SAM-dependent methyltransferase